MKRKSLLNNIVEFAFISALAILLSVGVFSYHVMNVTTDIGRWVRHTHEVLENIDSFFSDVIKIEASTRRFVLTGDESDAANFRSSVSDAQRHKAIVRDLTADNAEQQRRLSALDALLVQRIQRAELATGLRRAEGMVAAADEIRDGGAGRIMGELETVVRQVKDEETGLLTQRDAEAARLLRLSKIILVLGTFLGLLITAAAFWNVLRDNARRRLAERTSFAEKERAEVTLRSIGDGVLCTDSAGKVTLLNVVAEKMTGWSWQEATGRSITEVFQLLDGETHEPMPDLTEMAVRRDQIVHLPPNCLLVRRDGSEAWIEATASIIHDSEDGITGAVINFRDVSAIRSMGLQMTHSAEHDFLTGLPNRVLLGDRITMAIAAAQRHAQMFALLFLDLDNFKHINDSLGHPSGDKLLQSIAQRLLESVRGMDTVSRQGGDEFVILLTEVQQPEYAAIMAARLLRVVAEPHFIDHHDLHITTSIGISVYPDDGLDAETLIKNADAAMYQAKESGRQSYQFFKPEMNTRAVERQFIEEGLRRALERKEFVLQYQPVVDLATGAISGAEALIRWMHPTRGLVPPVQFIPVAEDCGLIVPIGAWVLREACTQAQAWAEAGLPRMTVAVNISALEFRHENFLETLSAIVSETGLDPKFLVLELTESVLMKHAEVATTILRSLRQRGMQVAIDDFGTGYSSLGYLQKFPLDALKIDQSFVRQISNSDDDTTIVIAVIALAQSLGLRVIAEGVEMPEELEFLRAHRCDEVQGYYFSRPVIPEQFAKLLKTGIPEPDGALRRDAPPEPASTAEQAA
jgi:diguanylate cyclase (GGDEF)-like protein/PAS domain S-box-containing protein